MGGRRNKSGKVWRAKVARVAKTVTLRNLETKLYEWTGKNSALNGAGTLITLYSNGGDTSGSNAPFQTLPLQFINPGTDEQSRIGNQITLKGMKLRFLFENDPAYTGITYVRIIVGWIDPNLTTVTAGNLLYQPALAGTNIISQMLKGPSHENSVLRRVVVDRLITLAPGNQVSGGAAVNQIRPVVVKVNANMHNKKYKFVNESAAQFGEQEDLYLFMFAFSPGQINTQIVANARLNGRVYYKDG